MMKTKGAQNGRSGTLAPKIPVPARPIKATAIQQASIAPNRVGSRNSPRLVISVSWGVNTFCLNHWEGDRTRPCFFCDDLGGSICKGFMVFRSHMLELYMYYPYDYSRSARINCKTLQRACQAAMCGKQGDLKVERSNCVPRLLHILRVW